MWFLIKRLARGWAQVGSFWSRWQLRTKEYREKGGYRERREGIIGRSME